MLKNLNISNKSKCYFFKLDINFILFRKKIFYAQLETLKSLSVKTTTKDILWSQRPACWQRRVLLVVYSSISTPQVLLKNWKGKIKLIPVSWFTPASQALLILEEQCKQRFLLPAPATFEDIRLRTGVHQMHGNTEWFNPVCKKTSSFSEHLQRC